jgi:hypothetical protein
MFRLPTRCRSGLFTIIHGLGKVSYGDETQWRYAEWETIGKKFPVGMKRNGAMSDRKLYANSFLSV